MIAVADTHAALWHLFDDPRLGRQAKGVFDRAVATQERVGLSTISLVEVVYRVEKRRLHATAYEELRAALDDPDHILHEIPVTADVVSAMRLVPRDAVPDMPDRIIAATVHLGVPVISRDAFIRASSVETIW
jgi:PIN domain nuclease of toxin-antitoxin system